MKRLVSILVFLFLLTNARPSYIQEQALVNVELIQVSNGLYLDNTITPVGFERDTLIRLYNFMRRHVIPNCRTPFPEYVNRLPIILRYVPFAEDGQFPHTTEGFAGWCDVVFVECTIPFEGSCVIRMSESNPGQARAFLALIAIPNSDNMDYLVQLWGITAHEIAHTLGAIDGPRCPYYEDSHLLAPVADVSDTYYWFGIASIFNPGWRGIIWDAWQDNCTDDLCDAFRAEVFQLP